STLSPLMFPCGRDIKQDLHLSTYTFDPKLRKGRKTFVYAQLEEQSFAESRIASGSETVGPDRARECSYGSHRGHSDSLAAAFPPQSPVRRFCFGPRFTFSDRLG